MAKLKEKIKKTWEAINFPDDIDKKYDEECDNAFNNAFDVFINVCYSFFFVFAIISLYFFITREFL